MRWNLYAMMVCTLPSVGNFQNYPVQGGLTSDDGTPEQVGYRLGGYRLKRLEDAGSVQRYQADFWVNLVGADGNPVPAAKASETLALYQQCYDAAEPFLTGEVPGGGRASIRLHMIEARDEAAPDLPAMAQNINIETAPLGVHSGAFNPSHGCATVLHESLHHLGFIDEYAADSFNAPCRPPEVVDSIMGNTLQHAKNRFFKAAPLAGGYAEVTCWCPPWKDYGSGAEYSKNLTACRREVKGLKGIPASCPAHTEEKVDSGYGALESAGNGHLQQELQSRLDRGRGKAGELDADTPMFTFLRKSDAHPDGFSILYPAQFRAILFPMCEAQTSMFYQCTRGALTGGDHGCPVVPTECSDPVLRMK